MCSFFFKFSFASVVILFLFAFSQFETVYFVQPEQFCQLWRDAAPLGGFTAQGLAQPIAIS